MTTPSAQKRRRAMRSSRPRGDRIYVGRSVRIPSVPPSAGVGVTWRLRLSAKPGKRRTLALARTEVAATMDCEQAVLEIVGSTSQGLQANHAKRTTTDHPAREDAAPMFWQTDTGSMLVIRVPPWDSQAMGAHVAAPPGSISTSIRSRHAAADRMRSRTCRTTFLEGG